MRDGLLTVIGALALGAFLIWVASTDLGKQIIARLVILGCGVACLATIYAVYNHLGEQIVGWARLTAAIILGMSVAITLSELVISHKIVDAIIRNLDYLEKGNF